MAPVVPNRKKIKAFHNEAAFDDWLRANHARETEIWLRIYKKRAAKPTVTIAQALACRPKLIVADEPFTSLDAPRVVELAALFRRLRDQLRTSFLIVSHHPGTLALTADYTFVLREGRLTEGEVRAR